MEDGAALLRSVVERTAAQYPRKAVKAVLKHCFIVLVVRNRIFRPLALDTLKTLNALLSVRQHIEHLEDRQWLDLVRVASSNALSAPVRLDNGMGDEAFLSDSDIDEDLRVGSTSKKKNAKDRRTDSTSGTNNAQELIEAFTLLAHLMHSPNANLVLLSQAKALLHRFSKLFHIVMPPFQTPIIETTAHLPLLQAFNGLLYNLVDNASTQLAEVAPAICLQLSRFWPGIKTTGAKEQTLIALKAMSPVIFTLPDRALCQQCCKAMYEVLVAESASRFRVEELFLGAIQLRTVPKNSQSTRTRKVFELDTLCWAPTSAFTQGQAMSWSLLSLTSDCLFWLFYWNEHAGATEPVGRSDEPGPGKRRKVEEPIPALLHTLSNTESIRERIHHLQILAFLVSTNWNNLHIEVQTSVIHSLQRLLTEDDPDVRSWTFCCLAAITSCPTLEPQTKVAKSAKEPLSSLSNRPWELIWVSALRNLSNRWVCRAAAHAANCLLRRTIDTPGASEAVQALVNLETIRSSISNIVDDLTVQGPGFPSDSVCSLFSNFIRFSETDTKLFHAAIPAKIFSWISTVWRPDARRPGTVKGEWEDPVAIVRLLWHIIGVDDSPLGNQLAIEVIPPQCDTVKTEMESAETARVRDFLYFCKFEGPRTHDDPESPPEASVRPVDMAIAHQIIAYLQQSIEALLPEASESILPPLSFEALSRAVKLLVNSLLFFGALRLKRPQAHRSLLRSASHLLQLLLPQLGSPRWSVTEKASLTACLGLIFPPSETFGEKMEYMEGLLYPGSTANVPAHLCHGPPKSRYPDPFLMEILHHIWSSEDFKYLISEKTGPLTLFLHNMAASAALNMPTLGDYTSGSISLQDGLEIDAGPAMTLKVSQMAATQMTMDPDSDVEFGTVRDGVPASIHRKSGSGNRQGVKSPAPMHSALVAPDNSVRVLCVVALRGLLSFELTRGTKPSTTLSGSQITALLCESEGVSLLALLEAFLTILASGTTQLELEEADSLFEMIGSSFLPAYEHARSSRVYSIIIRLLTATVDKWTKAAGEESQEQASNARKLCSWLSDVQNQSRFTAWTVRLDLVVFLDEYTRCDPREEFWGDEDLAVTGDGSPVVPTLLIPEMIKDPDFRVRFRVCSSSARIMEAMEEQKVDISAYFRGLLTAAPAVVDIPEKMLSRILCCANLMVIMAYIRRMAYESLLDISRTAAHFKEHLLVTLEEVSRRLHLPSLSSMFKTFIGYYAVRKSNTMENSFFQQLPVQVCGFTSTSARANEVFDELGGFYLTQEDQSQFTSLRKQAGIDSNAAAIRLCFPAYVARVLLNAAQTCFETMVDPAEAFEVALARIRATFESAEQPIPVDDFLSASIDRILSCSLEKMHASTFDPSSSVSAALSYVVPTKGQNPAILYHSMVAGVSPEPIYSHGEDYEATPCLQVCMFLLERYSATEQYTPIAYNVLRHLVTRIPQAVFLDEQRRLMGCLAVACVVFSDTLADPAITRTIAHGCASLYSSPDILHQSWSIFVTLIVIYLQEVQNSSSGSVEIIKTLPSLVLRVARMAQKYKRSGLSSDHILHLHNIISRRLLRSPDTRFQRQATLILALWPDEHDMPDFGLEDFDIISHNVEELGDDAINLVDPLLRVLPNTLTPAQPQLLGQILWLILSSADSKAAIPDVSLQALASALVRSGGQISPPSLGSSRHVNPALSTIDLSEASLKQSLVEEIAKLLLDYDLRVVDAAAQTLRDIFDLADPGEYESSDSRKDTARDIVYLASYSLRRPAISPKKSAGATSADLQRLFKVDYSCGSKWRTETAIVLLSSLGQGDPFFPRFIPLLHQTTSFARTIIPVLAHNLLIQEHRHKDAVLILSQLCNTILLDPSASLEALASVVDILLYLRRFRQPLEGADSRSGDWWLQVSWSSAAIGAIRTHGSAAALLCFELDKEPDHHALVPQPTESQMLQLQYQIYEMLDEPDGFYSIKAEDINEGLTRKYTHETRAESAYRVSGAIFEARSQVNGQLPNPLDVARPMASSGFTHQAIGLLGSGSPNTRDTLPYDLAWKTGAWDLPFPSHQIDTDTSASIYAILRTLRNDTDSSYAQQLLYRSMNCQARKLLSITHENPTPDREAVSALMLFHEVNNLRMNPAAPFQPSQIQRLPFGLCENIVSARLSLLRSARSKEEAVQWTDIASQALTKIVEVEQACHLHLSQAARHANQLDVSLINVTAGILLVKRFQNLSEEPFVDQWLQRLQKEQAFVLWHMGEHGEALKLMGHLLETIKDASPVAQGFELHRSLLLSQLGIWMHEARIRSDSDIYTEYFKPAVELLSDSSLDSQMQAGVHFKFVQFADSQLRTLLARKEEMRLLSEAQLKRQQQLADLKNKAIGSQGSRKNQFDAAVYESARVAHEEKKVLAHFQATKDRYLRLTVHQIIRVLVLSDDHDDLVYRLISLWFSCSAPQNLEKKSKDKTDRLHTEVAEQLGDITSAKFVFLAAQLTARLSKQSQRDSTIFRRTLAQLIDRLTSEHPYHLLYLLYNLRYSSGTPSNGKKSKRASSELENSATQAARVKAAEDVVNRLKTNTAFQERLHLIDLTCDAYHQWVNFNVRDMESDKKRKSDVPHRLPSNMGLRKLQGIAIPISTIHLPVSNVGRYDISAIPTIQRYDDSFKIAGGLNRPKISDCIGSDGKRYKQLFKGGDDTRQDAVMEQVFELVNILLVEDSATARRDLKIRTYRIVPLRSKTGVLEFVSNSQSLQEVLSSTLEKVYPNDLDYMKCRKILTQARNEASEDKNLSSAAPNQTKMVNALLGIYKKNRPVLRYKFFEAHKSPSRWFEMRLKYTRSVAVVSIIGYILGIGDRHLSNLLLDVVQGELVPIDFGYAFDGATRLAIPETVPFRLTRNVVDGFGSSGVEGVYRRCCEETFRVMRARESVVMTVLDVLKYDPLQRWDVSFEKVQRAQGTPIMPTTKNSGLERSSALASISENGSTDHEGDEEDEVPALAEQALRVVSDKIGSNGLSGEYKVNELIQQATDPARLSMLFAGWQPYA